MNYFYIIHVDSYWLLMFSMYWKLNDLWIHSGMSWSSVAPRSWFSYLFHFWKQTFVQIWSFWHFWYFPYIFKHYSQWFHDSIHIFFWGAGDTDCSNFNHWTYITQSNGFLKLPFHIFGFNSQLIIMKLFLLLLQHLNIYNLYVNVHYIDGNIQLHLYYTS